MKNIKKSVSILLTVLMLLSAAVTAPVTAGAATSGAWSYSVDGDKASITGYSGDGGDITIPSVIEGYTVTSIADNAIKDNTTITSIVIPDTVTAIGNRALYNLSITSVTIPNSVTTIGNDAFEYCEALESVTIPDSVTTIGNYAFEGCSSLTSLTIPDSVTSIGTQAFSGLSSLENLTIGSGITSIPEYAFGYCDSLKSLTIPDSVTSIDEDAFYNCGSLESVTIGSGLGSYDGELFQNCKILKSITVDEGNTNFSSEDGILYDKKKISLLRFHQKKKPSNMSFTVPDTVAVIGDYAFSNCVLKSVTLPDSVTTIGGAAFAFCEALKSVVIPDSVTSIAEDAFYDVIGLKIYGTDPSAAKDFVDAYGGSYIEFVDISVSQPEQPGEHTDLDDFEFREENGGLTLYSYYGDGGVVTIPSEVDGVPVKGIYYQAFYRNPTVTSVNIPEGVTFIDDTAFYQCINLESVNIPEGVTLIDYSTFFQCKKLKSIVIPDSVTEIRYQAFRFCSSLESVTFGSGLEIIDGYAFNSCNKLTNVVIPENVTKVEYDAFSYDPKLRAVVVLGSSTTFNTMSFSGCDRDKAVFYGQDPSTIKDYAYDSYHNYNFTAITADDISTSSVYDYRVDSDGAAVITGYKGAGGNITVPYIIDNYFVKGIDEFAFSDCAALTGVTIRDNIKSVGYKAFSACTSLKSAEIPDGVESIGDDAFKACASGFEIRGYDPSYAEDYARENELAFVSINDADPGNYRYNVDENNNAVIIGYDGTRKYIDVPSEIQGHKITAIADGAFQNLEGITRVHLPDTVESIGAGAFNGCRSLCGITIPDSVTSIGGGAFYECLNLVDITLPETLTSLGLAVFYNCRSLKTMVIPNGVSAISEYDVGGSMFYGCTSLESVKLPYGIETIGDRTFYNCSSLKSIVIPPRVRGIASDAFSYCSSLKSVTVPKSVVYSFNIDGSSDLTIYGYSGTMAETVAENKGWNFVALEDDSDFIFADAGHDELAAVGYEGAGGDINIPSQYKGKAVTIIDDLFGNSTLSSPITSVTIPDSVRVIGKSTFADCGFTSITLPRNLKSIGAGAFSRCSNLTDITIPEGVETIGNEAFRNCSKLESATIPSTVTSIGDSAFNYCSKLTSVTIPKNVKTIGSSAFENCEDLESAKICSRNAKIGDNAFAECPKLTIYGYDSSDTEKYATNNNVSFVPLLKINTGSGYTDAPLTDTQSRDSIDRSFGLTQDSYGNIELLGVQKKTDKGTNDIRFVAVINEGIINAATEYGSDVVDYGFIVAKSDYSSTMSATEDYISKIVLNAPDTVKLSCRYTDNTYSGQYGKVAANTKYKYVTLAVKEVTDSQNFVVRFYIRTKSGRVYYANYKNDYTGCVTGTTRMFASTGPEGENFTLYEDAWNNSPFFTV